MTTFQLLVVPTLLIVSCWSALCTIRRRISWRIGVFWTILWVTAAALVAFPYLTVLVARALGIGRGADLVLYATTLAGLGACLYFYTRYRRLEEIVTALVRREALRHPRRGALSSAATHSHEQRGEPR
jgi:hypothetical protein